MSSSSTVSKGRPADVSASMSHPFVALFFQQHMESLEEAVAEAVERVVEAPAAASAAPAPPSEATVVPLGTCVEGRDALAAIQSYMPGLEGARALAAALGGAVGCAAVEDVAAIAAAHGGPLRLWSGLCGSRLHAAVHVKPRALSDLPGMLQWVATAGAAS